jgi:hypothetical protein
MVVKFCLSENRVLRRIFGSSREEMVGGWRKLHNEELHNLYKILVGKPERKKQLGRPRRRWGIILEWILGKPGEEVWTGFFWLRIGTNDWLL